MDKKKQSYAVITGASSGIGAEFSKMLAQSGYHLILVARRRERLEQLAAKIKENKACESLDIQIVEADLEQEEACLRLVERIKPYHISIFINNAGFGACGYFPEIALQKELSMIDLNVRALHLLTKQILEKMQKQGDGFLLNVASSAGLIPAGPYMATYYASKAYVTSLTRAIAEELREHRSPVYIGCLCPGPVDTEFNDVANVKFALRGISANRCAAYALSQMKKRKVVIVPTFFMKVITIFGRFLPQTLYIKLTGHQQKKKMEKV